jgi:hypothetical protein
MRTSEQINELAAALSKAQGAMEAAKKDESNPYFKSKYADLAGVIEVSQKPLADNGLSLIQGGGWVEGTKTVKLTTRLMHSSGQWIEDDISVEVEKPTSQAVGSAITYCRRYSMQAFIRVAAEDDDAEGAEGRGAKSAGTGKIATEAKTVSAREMKKSEAVDMNDPAQAREFYERDIGRLAGILGSDSVEAARNKLASLRADVDTNKMNITEYGFKVKMFHGELNAAVADKGLF